MKISIKKEVNSNANRQVTVSEDVVLTIDKNKRLVNFCIAGISLKFSKLQSKIHTIIDTGAGNVTIEDLKTHPMNLANRWKILKNSPSYKLSDHQERFIVTFEGLNTTESYIIPKILEEDEPIARVVVNEKCLPIPFNIELAEVKNGIIQTVRPQKPKRHSKILLGTQILGHIQDAANVMRWAQRNGTLRGKWKFALPATQRTEVTRLALREEDISVDEVISDWSYSGGKDFRTGQEYREDFSKRESFSTVAAFVAVNARICADVARGEFTVVATNFRAEAQIMKQINPNIMTSGITHTFLAGKLNERLCLYDDIPRLANMLQRVIQSLDFIPERVVALGGDAECVDYYWKLCNQKIQMLDLLLYRTFDFDLDIPSQINETQVIQIPLEIPDIEMPRERAREYISSVIGKKLNTADKVVIFAGESDDGAFNKRVREVFAFTKQHLNVHVIMPLKRDDQRLAGLSIPENIHTIGFRKDWHEIIAGGDVAFIRGSWGEIRDLIASGTVPVITSLGKVPIDADLDTTQFITQVSEERACNISLLIETLKTRGVDPKMINRLLVDFDNPLEYYTLQEAIEYALQPSVASKIRSAFSSISRDTRGWVGKLHEQLLDQQRLFSGKELSELQKDIWT